MRIHLFDTTLRDGQQTAGVDFTLADKVAITRALDELGLDYIEGGWPGANPTDDAFFDAPPRLTNARLVAFGMTRKAGRSASNDTGLAPLLSAQVPCVCLVGKTWDFHVKTALEIDEAENLEMIESSLRACVEANKEALFDAEHFFDGYKANPAYALRCLEVAGQAGASCVVLCDTNGGTLPHEIQEMVTAVKAQLPNQCVGIHTHNDTENAVANTLAAVRSGAEHVQGTLNGLGERCGNANLISILPTLTMKMGYTTGVETSKLKGLKRLANLLDDRLNRPYDEAQPYVGERAFAHKGGLHVSALARDPRCYEHIDPESVGNSRTVVVSNQAGRSNIKMRLEALNMPLPTAEQQQLILALIKERELQGYSYDGADASFELLVRRTVGEIEPMFSLQRFRVIDDHRINALGESVVESEATVILEIGTQTQQQVAWGNGPVHALDQALRQALVEQWPQLKTLHLLDYKVRILSPHRESTGTDAITRVTIESGDSQGHRWWTIGASSNIIKASTEALQDSYSYLLAGLHRAAD